MGWVAVGRAALQNGISELRESLEGRPPRRVTTLDLYGRKDWEKQLFLFFQLFLFKNRTVSFDRRRAKSDRKRWGRQAAGVGPELGLSTSPDSPVFS